MKKNYHNTKEPKPDNIYEYEARKLRESVSTATIQQYTEVEIFLDILEGWRDIIKREIMINSFASREHCTPNCAKEVFNNRVRDTILYEHPVIQPGYGYYCLEKYYDAKY